MAAPPAMSPFGEAAVRCTQAGARLALAVVQPVPRPRIGGDGDEGSKTATMGLAYDEWKSQVVLASQTLGSLIDKLESLLPEDCLQDSFRHMGRVYRYTQESLEGSLEYHSPFVSRRHHGMVWSTRAEDELTQKTHARRVHRAASMELLLVHLAKLEYALFLGHTCDGQYGTRLCHGRAFERALVTGMQEIHGVLQTATRVGYVDLLGACVYEVQANRYLMNYMKDGDVYPADFANVIQISYAV